MAKTPVNTLVEHYAAVITETTQHWVEGDERSKTNPGHVYPAGYETRTTITYEAFATIEELADWVKYRSSKYKHYRLIKATPLTATTEVKVSING